MKKNFVNIKGFDDDEDDEDDENDSNKRGGYKNFETKTGAVIYLVDAREKMFLPSFDEATLPIIRCLETVRTALRTKIFRLEKCFCCIVLLGTKKGENNLKLSNVTVVQELELLGAHHILKIDELIKGSCHLLQNLAFYHLGFSVTLKSWKEDICIMKFDLMGQSGNKMFVAAVEDLSYEAEYGYSKFSLGDAFWLSSHIFNQRSKNLNKTVVLFTNDENPTSDDPNDENRATANAQDFYRSSVTFDLISLGKVFDYTKFYKKIVQASKNDANYVIPDPVSNVSEIVSRITKTNFKHVNLVKLPFVITDDFRIGVSIHFLVRKAKVPFKIKLSKATNERVYTKTEYFEEETGSIVKGDEIIKSQVVAQKDINFRPSELRRLQDIGKKELRLLGFKPASGLQLENFIKPCAFIYPDDTEYKGSSIFFTALLKRCIAKEVVAICTFCPRTTSSCRFVALLPQDELSQENEDQQLPPGFVVFFLPFAEEVRTIEEKITERADPEQVELAVKLIKKLKFSYKPSSFHNPKLKHHWVAIEALALDLKEPEKVGDCTIPHYELMSQRAGQIARDFMEAVYEEDYAPETFALPRKPRPAVFKTKMEKGVENVEDYVRQGKGEQLSNDVLKSYLKSAGVRKGLSKIKKSDLLEMVRSHLDSS